MKARPILFSAPMVRALLAGTKTQTRRVCKPAQKAALSFVTEVPDPLERGQVYNGSHFGDEDGGIQFPSPYGGIGDQLWVRETWQRAGGDTGYWYFASHATCDEGESPVSRWKPSIHMPRAASRVTLEVTNVRVERLNSISEADAISEGIQLGRDGMWNGAPHAVKGTPRAFHTAVGAYDDLWTQINGPESWAKNPWVWVVQFKVIKP